MKKEIQTEESFCEIKVRGTLEPRWEEWFDSMKIGIESDTTIISGYIADQPALTGLIDKISAVGLTVISIKFGDGKNREES